MPRIRYILTCILLVAVVAFPLVEKTVHELSHFAKDHCATSSTHFCEQPHNCDICDQIAGASLQFHPPAGARITIIPATGIYSHPTLPDPPSKVSVPPRFLRGPPRA